MFLLVPEVLLLKRMIFPDLKKKDILNKFLTRNNLPQGEVELSSYRLNSNNSYLCFKVLNKLFVCSLTRDEILCQTYLKASLDITNGPMNSVITVYLRAKAIS